MKTLKIFLIAFSVYLLTGCTKDNTSAPVYPESNTFSVLHKSGAMLRANALTMPMATSQVLKVRVLVVLFGEQTLSRDCKTIRITAFNGSKRYDSATLTYLCPGFQCAYKPMRECYNAGKFDTTGLIHISVEADSVVSIICPLDSFKIQVSEVSNNITTNYAFFSVNQPVTSFNRIEQNTSLTTYQSDSCTVAGVNIWNSGQSGTAKTMTIFLP